MGVNSNEVKYCLFKGLKCLGSVRENEVEYEHTLFSALLVHSKDFLKDFFGAIRLVRYDLKFSDVTNTSFSFFV